MNATWPDVLTADELFGTLTQPRRQNLLGLYEGIPWGKRGPYYAGALPDKITIYRVPLERISGGDPERLRAEVRRVVFHEIAHHLGISDARLVEIDRY